MRITAKRARREEELAEEVIKNNSRRLKDLAAIERIEVKRKAVENHHAIQVEKRERAAREAAEKSTTSGCRPYFRLTMQPE